MNQMIKQVRFENVKYKITLADYVFLLYLYLKFIFIFSS